jgi:pilus assembly protein Flp/PilA
MTGFVLTEVLFNMHSSSSKSIKEKGQGLVEYALILVLVAIVVIGVLMVIGPKIGNVFSTVNGSLTATGSGGVGGSVTTADCAASHTGGYATGAGYATPCYAPGIGGYFP